MQIIEKRQILNICEITQFKLIAISILVKLEAWRIEEWNNIYSVDTLR